MAFSLFKSASQLNLSGQTGAWSTGGPSSGIAGGFVNPWPKVTPFFCTLQTLPYGTASSNASPTPYNNRYARPFSYTIGGGLQKMPTYTNVVY